VMIVLGTRPEAIKLAPVALALMGQDDLVPLITVTGQHRSMLDQVLRTFRLTPHFDLNVIRPRQTLSGLTKRLIERLDLLILSAKPQVVLVQGDTTTTFAGALTAFYHRIPVVHLEAGMRTGDMSEPFPEEMNRVLTTRLAKLHLAPTAHAKGRLIAEGVPGATVFITGNTVIDALQWTLANNHTVTASLSDLMETTRPLLLVTAHRRESWGEPLQQIVGALADIAFARPDLQILFPVHRNPAVSDVVRSTLSRVANVRLTPPLTYPDFALFMRRATIILTDSGGVQEEAPSLGTPVLVMREKTERPEAIDCGTSLLVGTGRQSIVNGVLRLLADQRLYDSMAQAANPYGDGQAAGRVVAALRHLLYGAPPPAEFSPPAS
jgi:UDP-N-acetylglucosamine 2-epimerase (non-hydrolysing)